MATTTVENYVKRIYLEQQRAGGDLAAMGKLAAAMAVAPGTATAMVKSLARSGLVEYEPRAGVRLTDGGRRLALRVLRRHRLVELFLVETLGLDWAEVHEEAERLEHAISDRLLDRMDEHLGRPVVDPHGDPIPSPEGKFAPSTSISLADTNPGSKVEITRIRDQTPAFLRFIERSRLTPGATVSVKARDRAAEAIDLSFPDGRRVTIGLAAAAKIRCAPLTKTATDPSSPR